MGQKLKIVVGGFIGLYPTGGVTWDYLQYPLGLQLMGHDVYYIEDTVQYSRYQKQGRRWDDASDSIQYLKEVMEQFGFRDRWAYRDVASGNCFGMSYHKVRQICREADLFINISASTFLREEYLEIPLRVLIDSDPMFTQIDYYNECYIKESTNEYRMKFVVEHHTHHATFGENIGAPDCRIPTFGFHWQPTRQPICLDYWKLRNSVPRHNTFTTVMNWSVKDDLIYENEKWGQKNRELDKVKALPQLYQDAHFELMLAGANEEKILDLTQKGWNVRNALAAMNDTEAYQQYIYESLGEFSVAKETYVKSRSGWFSCRSACYLAASKPVITQETGWSAFIPSGKGLFAFQDIDAVMEALRHIKADYDGHSRAARQIAQEYFDHRVVLKGLIDFVQCSPIRAKQEPVLI